MRNDLNAVIADLSAIEFQLEEIKNKRERIVQELTALTQSEVESQLQLKEYNCGTANLETDNYNLKIVVGKKVKWDGDKLAQLYDRIKESGDNPKEYMKVILEVAESKFKNWPSHIQDAFVEARTVEKSTPRITYERKETTNG